jgi:predicted transcriptional regulator
MKNPEFPLNDGKRTIHEFSGVYPRKPENAVMGEFTLKIVEGNHWKIGKLEKMEKLFF